MQTSFRPARLNRGKLRVLGRFGAGAAVSGIALYAAARGIDWVAIPGHLGRADWLLLLAGCGVLAASLGLFALRWWSLIPAPQALPPQRAFACLMVGYLANTVLPLRLGDAARLGLASRRSGLSLSLLAATLAVERLMDLAVLAAAGVGFGLVAATPAGLGGGLFLVLGLAVAGLVGLSIFGLAANQLRAAMPHRAGGGHSASLVRWVGHQLASFRQGLWTLRTPAAVARTGGLSVLAWAGVALATGLWARAFGLPVPWYGAILLVVAVNLAAALPSAPAGIGVYHLAVVFALSGWVANRELALAYAVTAHGLNSALNIVVGLGCLLTGGTAGPVSPSGPVECLPSTG